MVGRLRENKLGIQGGGTATEWPSIALPACDAAHVDCTVSGDGYGPSDQTPFFAAGVPVLFFFTGAHPDYHKPSDTADKINAAGAGQIAKIVGDVAAAVSSRDARLTFVSSPAPPPAGDMRHSHASLGTVPDYSGTPAGTPGMRIAGVRAGGPAEKAGIQRGDVLVSMGGHAIASVEDLMYALDAHQPGEVVDVEVVRDGRHVKMKATLGEAHRR
jgi:C-terminal processing protease CtpA/Prc